MAQIATLEVPYSRFRQPLDPNQQFRTFTFEFSPTQLAANVTQGDNILVFTAPKYCRIVDADLRLTGVAGLGGCFLTLRSTESATSTVLISPMSATYSGASTMAVAPPRVDNTVVKTIEILVGGNSVDNTATGILTVNLNFDNYRVSG